MEETKKDGRGGFRKGAGAKARDGVRRVQLGCVVHPDTLAFIKEQSEERGLSVGMTIDEIIREMIEANSL